MNPVLVLGLQELFLRLGAAVLIGGLLGLNRELHGKPAGLRTHALVTLGAAMATTLALPAAGAAVDPNAIGRIIQGILTGVGFLGAGVILRDAGGHVTGLTTAATIWVCAGLGIMCALAYWEVIGIVVGLTLAVLLTGRAIERAAERVFKRPAAGPPDHNV